MLAGCVRSSSPYAHRFLSRALRACAALAALAALALVSGCIVTETMDIGQPRMRAGSQKITRGVTTTEELIATMGVPFAVSQGQEEGVEVFLYVDLRKRQKTLMIPPLLPLYALTRVSEKKRAMLVILKDRRVVEYLILSIEDIAKKKEFGFGDQDTRLLLELFGN